MWDHALRGSRGYWLWLGALVFAVAVGVSAWLQQLDSGLVVTGLGRDVSWGLYIAQFTFLVGVAASAVTVVLPYYLHDCKAFGPITVLGELLAIAAVTCAAMFIVVDMGQPARVLNVLLYPSPASLMFWDMIALGGYLVLNAVIACQVLAAERHELPPARWLKPLVLVSIPWAISIHTVTAFLYSGLPGRSFWLTALLAPRFLASAFASGPSLLILLALVMRRAGRLRVSDEALRRLSIIVAYALAAHLFFLLAEAFTAFYSRVPAHVAHLRYLFADGPLAPLMTLSVLLAATALAVLLVPRWHAKPVALTLTALAVVVAIWIEKGVGLIVGGFVPTPLESVAAYAPTRPELEITVGIWAVGTLMVTVFYKIVAGIRDGHAETAPPTSGAGGQAWVS